LETRQPWLRGYRLGLRSDNGASPCAKRFGEYLSQHGIQGQYTGYDAPADHG
jgi:hypothetical protein